MNIELLEEVKFLLEEGKTVQEIANDVAITKSSLLLMLRMDYILEKKYDLEFKKNKDDLELLNSENIKLLNEKKELESKNDLLRFRIQELQMPFVYIPFKYPDFSFYKERNITLENENYLLLEKNRILQTSLNKIPMFIKKIFT